MTTKMFRKWKVRATFVVSKDEEEIYRKKHGEHFNIMIHPDTVTDLVSKRNFIKWHAKKMGFERHWQVDDNIYRMRQWYKKKRIECNVAKAMRVCEDFTDRYENVWLSGFNYYMFSSPKTMTAPFRLNRHVYSFSLFLSDTPLEFRGPSNEDVDMCLQILASGNCIIQLTGFVCDKQWTQHSKGGNTTDMYYGDNRLKNAEALKRRWPGIVTVKRRFNRPHFIIKNGWRFCDNQLIRKKNIKINNTPNNYGLHLVQKKSIKSKGLQQFYDKYAKK